MIGFYSAFLLAPQLGLGTSTPLETRQFGASATGPPYYPAPKGGSSASWAEAYSKAYNLVSRISLLEKVNVTTGTGWATHLPGEESGNTLADVLYGDVNPSGKLPYTIGKTLADYGPTAGVMYTANANPPYQDFTEGLYIDYRYFDKNDITPRYEFGFGMSYTTFEFSDLETTHKGSMAPPPAPRPAAEVEPPTYGSELPDVSEALFPEGFTKINRMIYSNLNFTSDVVVGLYPCPEGYESGHPLMPAGGGEGGNPALWEVVYGVCITLKNTGDVAGAEVAQLYIQFQNTSIDFPVSLQRV